MASDQSANLALPYLAAAQAQKHVTHNEAVRRLDAYVQLALESVTAPAPPAAPDEGARWFVPAGAGGAFAGQAGKLAAYEAGAFDFLAVPRDTLAYVRDAGRFARFDGAAWVPLAAGSGEAGAPLVLESITAAAPPSAPGEGASWFVPAGATGAFAGHDGKLASFVAGAFTFRAPVAGTLAFVRDEWRLALHDGGDWVSPLAVRPARAAIEARVLEEDLVLSGSMAETTIAIPARAIVLGVSTRTLSAVTGAASYDCGIAGEAGKFGALLGAALGSFNSGVIGPTAFYAATPVRLTANGGAFTGGRVRVSIHILMCPASAFPQREAAWWTDAPRLLDGVAPSLAADFSRERYALGGAHGSSTSILQRTGGAKTVVSAAGERMTAPANTLAFDYSSGRRRLLLEGAATNLFIGSAAPVAAQNITVTAQPYTLSFWGTGAMALSGAASATVAGTGANARTAYTFTPAAGTLTLTPSGSVTNVQLEVGGRASSHIATTSTATARVTDVCALSSAAVAMLPSAGPCTLAWRGASSQTGYAWLVTVSGKELIRRSTDGLSVLAVVPLAQGTGLGIAAVGITPFGIAIGWDGSGGIGSTNGGAATSNTTTPSGAITSAHIGAGTGVNGWIELDELLVWPAKGAAAAVQAQARAWS
ncbi:DUF2793 domain-containing protein [Xanthobacter sediminis]|uniref:DUF2793 domain-containing protein n=1 Tax=Xanthobacter sediminis TaxID=3119926 RepID=UPI003728B91D